MKSDRNSPIHLGKGLYLAPYRGESYKIQKGDGLYLTSYKGDGIVKTKTRKTKKNLFPRYPIERCTIMRL